MITKGIVKSIINDYEAVVNVPLLDSDVNCIISSLPNSRIILQLDDIVFVAFEDYDLSKGVIIGFLFKENSNLSSINLELDSLQVNSKSTFSKSINIGNISYEQLQYLSGLSQNIQTSLKNIEDRLDRLEGNS